MAVLDWQKLVLRMLMSMEQAERAGSSMVSSGMERERGMDPHSCSTDYRGGGKNWMDFVTVLVSLVCSSGVNARNFIPAF